MGDNVTQPVATKVRRSDFEIMRIISMLFVITMHFVCDGLAKHSCDPITIQAYNIFSPLGKIGYCTFVTLSCYFLIDSKFKFKKFLIICFEAVFYTLIFAIIVTATGYKQISVLDWIRLFIPFLGYGEGFVFCYLYLYALSPLLNWLCHKLKTKHLIYIIIGINLFEWAFMYCYSYFNVGRFPIIHFVLFPCYFFMVYLLKKYKPKFTNYKSLMILILGACYALMYCFNLKYIHSDNKFLQSFIEIQHNYESAPLDMVAGFALFYLFMFKKPFYSKPINIIASTTFSVLIVHHNDAFRDFFWNKIIHVELYTNYGYYVVPVIIGFSIAIYLGITIIELLRRRFIEKPLFKIEKINTFCNKIDSTKFFSMNHQFINK